MQSSTSSIVGRYCRGQVLIQKEDMWNKKYDISDSAASSLILSELTLSCRL